MLSSVTNVTSSEAVLPILPNIALAERKKRLFGVIYGTPKLSTLYNVCANITYFIGPRLTVALAGSNVSTDIIISN